MVLILHLDSIPGVPGVVALAKDPFDHRDQGLRGQHRHGRTGDLRFGRSEPTGDLFHRRPVRGTFRHQRVNELVQASQARLIGFVGEPCLESRAAARIPRVLCESFPILEVPAADDLLARGEEMKEGPQGESVRRGAHALLAADLLRRRVLRRADEGARPCDAGCRPNAAPDSRDPEVGEADNRRLRIVVFQEHVAGFEVPVNDARVVDDKQGQRELPSDRRRRHGAEWPLLPHETLYGAAFHVAGDEVVVRPPNEVHRAERDDVGMIEELQHLRFDREALGQGTALAVGMQHLGRDPLLVLPVPALVGDAGRPRTEHGVYVITIIDRLAQAQVLRPTGGRAGSCAGPPRATRRILDTEALQAAAAVTHQAPSMTATGQARGTA